VGLPEINFEHRMKLLMAGFRSVEWTQDEDRLNTAPDLLRSGGDVIFSHEYSNALWSVELRDSSISKISCFSSLYEFSAQSESRIGSSAMKAGNHHDTRKLSCITLAIETRPMRPNRTLVMRFLFYTFFCSP
jgi:hypothetical protein